MQVKAVFVLTIVTCAVFTSCIAMTLEVEESQKETDSLDMAFDIVHGLERLLSSIREHEDSSDDVGDNSAEERDDIVSRRRRMIGGMPRVIISTGKGKPRPPVYRPRWNPDGNPASSVSLY